jgi:hypothetical protein
MWRRLTTFLYGEAFSAPRDLPQATSFSWLRETALGMLHGELTNAGLPAGSAPVLANLIATWIPDRAAAVTYTEPLLVPGATLPSLWWAPDPSQPNRIGLLTDPSLLVTRPLISGRGAWLNQHVFCRAIPPPPVGEFTPPEYDPGLTRRERLAVALASPVCTGCHNLLDTPGFSLEHFDEMGEFRTIDAGKPVDSSGEIRLGHLSYEEVFQFADVEDLAKQLADSCFVGQCFAQQVWTDAVERAREKPAPVAPRSGEIETILVRFAADRYSIDALISAVVTSPSFAGPE